MKIIPKSSNYSKKLVKGILCSCDTRKPDKKFWGLQMLNWVWLARAKPELTKPKSTFRPQNFLSGLHAPHKQTFPSPTMGGLPP